VSDAGLSKLLIAALDNASRARKISELGVVFEALPAMPARRRSSEDLQFLIRKGEY